MSKYTDLHFHSIYSEGSLTPNEIITIAKSHGVRAMALTDHNTIAGVNDFLFHAKKHGIEAIPGVEMYAKWRRNIYHILGYNFNPENSWLKASLEELCADRIREVENALYIVQKKGLKVDMNDMWTTKSHYIGFGQILRWLEKYPKNKKRFKKDLKTDTPGFFDVINYYFKQGRKPLLNETALPVKTVFAMITKAGGIPVLAHPGKQLTWEQDKVIEQLKNLGLKGLEVISPHHNWSEVEHYLYIAKRLNLKITGGSDFHSPLLYKGKHAIKYQWQYQKPPYNLFQQLMK